MSKATAKSKLYNQGDFYITKVPINNDQEFIKYAEHFPIVKDKKELENIKNKILPGTGVTVIINNHLVSMYKKSEKDKYTIGTFIKNIF